MKAHTLFRITITLAIALGLAAPAGLTALAQAPANDNFADAISINSTPFNDGQDLSSATIESDEPRPSCVGTPGNTIWYKFTPGASGLAETHVYTENYYMFLAVYTGNELLSITENYCFQYGWDASFDVQAGITYYLQIGSMDQNAGWTTFRLDFIPIPSNDNFADAMPITESPFNVVQNISAATIETNEQQPNCDSYFAPEQTVWYVYSPNEEGAVLGYLESDFYPFIAVYRIDELATLTQIGCWVYVREYLFNVNAGEIYYLQVGSMWGEAGTIQLTLDFNSTPSNDNFDSATDLSLGDSLSSNLFAASADEGEPRPTCGWNEEFRSVWFKYTSSIDRLVTADPSEGWEILAAYTGTGIDSLHEVMCRSEGDPLPILAKAGTTYYFQVSPSYGVGDDFVFQFYETPPPIADFTWSPNEPNIFDNVEFCDSSLDPVKVEITNHFWEFSDGASTTGNCVYHIYPMDGEYTISHNIQTADGRSDPDGITKTVNVRTHDVAITRVATPLTASVGQTRAITVEIKNTRYQEAVHVVLYKSIVSPWDIYEMVAEKYTDIPVRKGNRTSHITFNYTFTSEDAAMGKVTFKAVVYLDNARDAFPADNEAFSTPPTKVTGKQLNSSPDMISPQ